MAGNDRGSGGGGGGGVGGGPRYNGQQRRNAIYGGNRSRFPPRGRLGGQGSGGGGGGGDGVHNGGDHLDRAADSDPGSYGGGPHHQNNRNNSIYHQRNNKSRVTFKHSGGPAGAGGANSRYKYTNNRQLGQRILKDQDNDTVMAPNEGTSSSSSLHQDVNRSTLSQRLARNITRRTQDIARYSVRNRQQQNNQHQLRIGESTPVGQPVKPLVPSQPFCKLNGVDQAVFDYCVQFIKQYFTCFDQNREELLAAYHRKAVFSLAINSNSKAAQAGPKFGEYYTSSRNLLHVTPASDKCHKMLHIGSIDIVAFINKFPPTEHNMDSFKFDISYFTTNMLKLSVAGVFKEGAKTDKFQGAPRTFQRVFICVPVENGRVVIVNDQLVMSHMPIDQSKMRSREENVATSAAATSGPRDNMAAASIQRTQDPRQQMIAQFCRETNLNVKWSNDCLEYAEWDYNKALQTFIEHRSEIPAEAFL